MKKTILFLTLILLSTVIFAQDFIPPDNVAGVSNEYGAFATIAVALLSFFALLLKMIFDNKKQRDIKDYADLHNQQHELDNQRTKLIERKIDNNTEKIDKLSIILENTVEILNNQLVKPKKAKNDNKRLQKQSK